MSLSISTDTPFALLENTRDPNKASYLFQRPVGEVVCYSLEEVASKLVQLDQLRAKGLYLCGYLAYEAAYALADRQTFRFKHSNSPLLHFYAFAERQELSAQASSDLVVGLSRNSAATAIRDVQLNMSQADYKQAIEKVRELIREGDSYQINYTLKYRFGYQGSAICLYSTLRRSQSVEFASYLNFPEYSVLSLSPELFIEKRGNSLVSRPMKGTAARGKDAVEDAAIVAAMQSDAKTLSENVMIVDLMRNDLSRVAQPGSVAVEKLFEVQRFETLHQMVSTVKASIDTDVSFEALIRGLFPCGSITGAPKLRTMELIEQLELEPRGVYTGAIGYITPENDFCFSVPIRTCIARSNGEAEMGVGGGILYESDAQDEFDECRLKGRFLTQLNSRFKLIESMRYDQDSCSIPLFERHLERLSQSARVLGFHLSSAQVGQRIQDFIATLTQTSKVRLLLCANGEVELSSEPLADEQCSDTPYVDLATERTNTDEWMFHFKSTQRELYNRLYEQHAAAGAYDVLFLNQQGHLSEASRHNLFIELQGELITPPLGDAVLPGVYRQKLIDEAQLSVVIRSLKPIDLLKAERIILTNAVRGSVDVKLSQQARDGLIKLIDTQAETIDALAH